MEASTLVRQRREAPAPLDDNSINNLIESKRPDKGLHRVLFEAEYIISKLNVEDMQILDPLLG